MKSCSPGSTLRRSGYSASWLPKSAPRTPKRGRVAVDEVWSANGNHCSHCDKSRGLCEELGIGRTAQHVVPFCKGGDAWPLIPYCARCQQASAAALAETQRIEERVGSLFEVIRRIEKQHPELLTETPPAN